MITRIKRNPKYLGQKKGREYASVAKALLSKGPTQVLWGGFILKLSISQPRLRIEGNFESSCSSGSCRTGNRVDYDRKQTGSGRRSRLKQPKENVSKRRTQPKSKENQTSPWSRRRAKELSRMGRLSNKRICCRESTSRRVCVKTWGIGKRCLKKKMDRGFSKGEGARAGRSCCRKGE